MTLKSIYLLHHSHYDRGYTHSPVVIDHLQADFINQAIEMLETTEDWEAQDQPRWTIEVHEQLRRWQASATPQQVARFKRQVAAGRIGLGALQYNTTPLSSIESLCHQIADIRAYRQEFGLPVKVAFQHDVNGVPWVLSDLLLDAGIELLVMAINLHMGGNGPKRPCLFRWKTPAGRYLKVFSGHHYGTFDAIAEPATMPLDQMKANVDEFWQRLIEDGYPYDFLYLSTTQWPIGDDNSAPNMMAAHKIRQWNRQKHYPKLEYVTPEQLIERLNRVPDECVGEHRGDWTDFWNFGAGSTASETALNADSKSKLFSAGLLTANTPTDLRLAKLMRDAWDQVVLYDEHTWGMAGQVSRPDHAQCVSAKMTKLITAHNGQELARYVQAARLAAYAGNPVMHETQGLLAINPSPVARRGTVNVMPRWKALFGDLVGFQYRMTEAADPLGELTSIPEPSAHQAQIDLPPFSAVRIPWSQMQPPEPAQCLNESTTPAGTTVLESDAHRLEFDPANGRILRLFDKAAGHEALATCDEYDLLTPVHEKPDPAVAADRRSFYRTDHNAMRLFADCWNPDWRAVRSGPTEFVNCRVLRDARTISLVRENRLEGAHRIIQKFELSADRPWIEVIIIIHKDRVVSPEAIYFASRLNLADGWQATFDSSGTPVKLDDDQLPNVSRGWITAGAFTRMEDARLQFSVFAPEIPLAQLGGFNFGRPPETIARPANPLHLLWPCNNYWETNFAATQEGVIRLRCAVHTWRGQTISETYRLADAYARRPLFLPLAACDRLETSSLLEIDNRNVRLVSVVPARFHDGIIYRLANGSHTDQTCQVRLGHSTERTLLISPAEDIVGSCPHQNGQLTVSLSGFGVVSILTKGSHGSSK